MRVKLFATGLLTAGVCLAQDPSVDNRISDEVVKKVDPSVVAIQHEKAGGSGFVVSPDGYILTNGHVVRGQDEEDPTQTARSITVVLFDDRKFSARVIGFSMDPDVALLKIESEKPLQPVEYGDVGAVQIGQACFAVGTPVGLKRTFTSGILSNVERTNLGTETKVFQTDAAINPGNSGGPLFDRNGLVLGLNTYGSRGRNNLGFTIPIDVALVLKEHFLKYGRFVRALVPRFFTQEIYAELAQTLGVDKGILIPFVEPGSAAGQAGLADGDILVDVNGEPCSARNRVELLDFDWDLATREPGEELTFTVLRGPDRERHVVKLTLEAMGPLPRMGRHAGELMEIRYGALDLGIKELVPEHRLIHKLPDAAGVLVTTVGTTGTAKRAGLRKRDILTHVDGHPTPTPATFQAALEAELAGTNEAIAVTVARGQTVFPTALAPFYVLKGRRVALVVPPGETEYVDLLRRELLAEGAAVRVVALEGDAIAVDTGEIEVDGRPSDLEMADLDVLVLAGGAGGSAFKQNDEIHRLVREAHAGGKVIAAIGPSALALVIAEPELLETKITMSRDASGEAMQRGAKYSGEEVVTDGKVVTTTGFDRPTVRKFVKALVRAAGSVDPHTTES